MNLLALISRLVFNYGQNISVPKLTVIQGLYCNNVARIAIIRLNSKSICSATTSGVVMTSKEAAENNL